MKYFSVFVLCLCVRASYSYYVGSPVASNPTVSSNQNQIFNTQALPDNSENGYPRTQENSVQPSPIQQQYTMGPGYPIPYQVAQIAPDVQNNVQLSSQANTGGLPPHTPAVQHAASHPYLKEIYKASVPRTRYTIIHPNGTIEHTNELHVVTARYPKYVMVKATDILAQAHHPNTYKPTIRHVQNTLPNYITKPITTTNENFEQTSTSSQNIGNAVASNLIPANEAYPNSKTQNTIIGPADIPSIINVISSNPSSINERATNQNVQELDKIENNILTQSIPNETNKKPSNIQNISRNVVAGNPLPIYSPTSLPEAQVKYKQPSELPSANSANSKEDAENQIFAKTISTTPITVEAPVEVDKVLPVILPKINQQNSAQETQTASTTEERQTNEFVNEVATIEEPIISQNTNVTAVLDTPLTSKLATVLTPNTILDVSSPKDTLNQDVQPISTSQISTNTSNTTKSDNNPKTPSVSNQSPLMFGNRAPLTWFNLSEDKVWEAIRSNSSNVYFFFLPPRPKLYKETRTTIYPNGTTVEETIITDVEKDQDGNPKVTKSSKIIIG